MSGKSILFISNGYGEDTIAARIIRGIKERPSTVQVSALPLVGEGGAYEGMDVTIIGPRRLMPSGGMIPEGIGNLVRDVQSGLGRLTLEQIRAVRTVKSRVDMTVPVGDIYPVIISSMFSRRPIVMVGTAKSDYFVKYNGFERFFMHSFCQQVFARDEITAASLRKYGISAQWVGNVMMDSLEFSDEDFSPNGASPCVGILPGSRDFAYHDIVVLMGAVEEIWNLLGSDVFFVMALAGSTDVRRLAQSVAGTGWKCEHIDENTDDFVKDGIKVRAVKKKFGDILRRSAIIIGQAGTGNEQAVGMGRPVVTFDSSGKQSLGWYRRRQKGLLGDSISVVEREKSMIAREVYAILNDKGRYEAMRRIGYERMGPEGAAGKIARYIMAQLGEMEGS